MKVKWWLGLPLFFCVLLAGCDALKGNKSMKMQISSPDFEDGGMIPKQFTCDGDNLPPSLVWSKAPAGTQELVLIMDDPDAPSGTYVHWVLFNISPTLTGLGGGTTTLSDLSGIGVTGSNSSHHMHFDGPCPPEGPAHRYYFKIYALKEHTGLDRGATKTEVEKAMKNYILAEGQLIGKYAR
jgi:Raf kinase inhibitor-like YbhB/YbcL family protein